MAKLNSNQSTEKKRLNSKIDCSQSSKHLAFRFCYKHQNKHCGTNLHKSIFQCLLNLCCQDANCSLTLYGISQWIPNKQNKKKQRPQPQLICY